jgi:8-oxo-dGTP diphosphatase
MSERMRLSSGSVWESEVGYSRLVKSGSQIEVAGTVAVDESGRLVGEGDAYAQTRFCLEKIEYYLQQAGAVRADVVRTRMYVTDIRQWPAIGKAHAEFFGARKPASTMIEIAGLVDPRMLVEVEVTAICQAPEQPAGTYIYAYPRPAVTVDCLVLRGLPATPEILLIQRRKAPFRDQWALPGGFIEIEEELQAAAARELREETGLSGLELRQFRTYGQPDRDPRGRTLSVVFAARFDGSGPALQAGDDAADAAWFSLGQLPPLAFDHDTIIADALEALGKGLLPLD